MEPLAPNKKLEPGVYQGNPDSLQAAASAQKPARLIHTMKSDMAEAITRQNETSVSIAIAEEKKRDAERVRVAEAHSSQAVEPTPAPKRIGRLVVVIIVLIIIAILGLAYVFVLPKIETLRFQLPQISLPSFGKPAPAPTATKQPPTLVPSIIPAQSEKKFDIGTEVLGKISAEAMAEYGSGSSEGAVKNLYFVETIGATSTKVSAAHFLSFANARAPDILARSLENEFMAGFLGDAAGEAAPFLILKVSDYNTGLAGMLEWEPNLARAIDSLLGTTLGTDTSVKFHSIIVGGKDARILTAPFGGTIVYAFADQNTIIITSGQSSLEVLITLARTPTSR